MSRDLTIHQAERGTPPARGSVPFKDPTPMDLSQRRSFEHDFSSSEAQREYVVERRVVQTRTKISQSAHDSSTKNAPRASSTSQLDSSMHVGSNKDGVNANYNSKQRLENVKATFKAKHHDEQRTQKERPQAQDPQTSGQTANTAAQNKKAPVTHYGFNLNGVNVNYSSTQEIIGGEWTFG